MLQRQTLELNPWLHSLVNKYRASGLTISLELRPTDHLTVTVDPKYFGFAVNNLLSNAIKFAATTIQVRVEQRENDCLLCVDDDGSGLATDANDALFNEYTAAHAEHHIGVGLAVVKHIMALHGGRVSAMASPHLSGARFEISLPFK